MSRSTMDRDVFAVKTPPGNGERYKTVNRHSTYDLLCLFLYNLSSCDKIQTDQ